MTAAASPRPSHQQIDATRAVVRWYLRGSKRLHQLSKRWADSREFWGLAGVQALGEFMKYDADLWRKASANKGLRKSASYCVEQ